MTNMVDLSETRLYNQNYEKKIFIFIIR